jgi:hypothetical protein
VEIERESSCVEIEKEPHKLDLQLHFLEKEIKQQMKFFRDSLDVSATEEEEGDGEFSKAAVIRVPLWPKALASQKQNLYPRSNWNVEREVVHRSTLNLVDPNLFHCTF